MNRRRKPLRNRLLIGAAATVLVAMAIFAAPINATPADAEPTSLTVPAGHLGDDGSYAAFSRVAPSDAWAPEGAWGFRIADVGPALDQTGMKHDAVRVVTNVSRDAWATDLPTGWGTYDWVTGLRLDLTTRHALTVDFEMAWADGVGDPQLATDDGRLHFEDYGPEFSPYLPSAWDSVGMVPFLMQFQGLEVATDDPGVAGAGRLLDAQWVLHEPGQPDANATTRVVGTGQVDGVAAIQIRTDGCVSLALDESQPGVARYWRYERGHADRRLVPFLHASVPARSDVCFQVDTWVSDASAYPILYRESVEVGDGGSPQEWMLALSRLDEGDAPVPWADDGAAVHYLKIRPDVEFTPAGQLYPADGTSSWPPYKLSAALAAVDGDPTLMEFQAWREDHPDNFLAAAAWYDGHASTCVGVGRYGAETLGRGFMPASYWSLIYGVPEGEYYVVYTTQAQDGSPPSNCEYAAISGYSFDLKDLPAKRVTVAEIERAWRLTQPEGSPEPNYLSWGPIIICDLAEDAPYPVPRLCDPTGEQEVVHSPIHWPWAWIGHYVVSGQDGSTGYLDNSLFVDLATGNLVERNELAASDVIPPFGGPRGLDAPPALQAVAQPGTPDVRPAAVAAAVAGGLVGLLLLVYVYPWIKYHGAGLFMAVAGYAKLRKDKVLDNALREQILDRIRTDPGVSPPEIHKAVDAGWSTVVYHLGVLEKNGLVSSLVDGRHKRFFPADSVDWSRRGELAALKNDRTKQIYHLLLEEPGMGRRDLAKRVGVTPSAIDWHVDRLEAASLAGIDKDGRPHRIYANPTTAASLPQGVEVA